MHHPTDRIAHITAFVTPVVEYWLEHEIAQWVHPMKYRSDDPSHHERTLLSWYWAAPRYSSVVERLLIVRWVVGSIPHGGLVELFLVPALLHEWCNKGLSVYTERTFAANRKE